MIETPKVFISYSWTSPEHQDWVINLAERLVSDGVDVVIDKWDLKEGQDKFNFMETMVRSSDINRILIILDQKYSEKAEQRSGGVGTETQIISPKIYSNVSQEKFVPIVTEKNENGEPFVPTYLESRIYIDLSEQDHFEENYEHLLRNIFKRPAYNKPELGKAPSYLFEETPMSHRTSSIIRSFDNQINKNPKRINSLLRDFLDEFYNDLKGYSIIFTSKDLYTVGKEICDNINSYTPIRNDFINFIDKIIKSEIDFDIGIIIRFFERLPLLTKPLDDRMSWSSSEFDNYRFLIHEIFLYIIAIGLKNENYKFIEELLYSSYFFQDKHKYQIEPQRFDLLYSRIEIIDQFYKQTFSMNFVSPMADIMNKRVPEGFDVNHLIDADLLCHYVSVLENLFWFPITYIFRVRVRFELFEKLISLKHFEKVKTLLNVKTPEELKYKLNKIQESDKNNIGVGYLNSFERVKPIYRLIDIEKVGTLR